MEAKFDNKQAGTLSLPFTLLVGFLHTCLPVHARVSVTSRKSTPTGRAHMGAGVSIIALESRLQDGRGQVGVVLSQASVTLIS